MAGVELGCCAVDIQKGAGKLRRDQRRAQLDHAGEQFVDKGVLGTAQA